MEYQQCNIRAIFIKLKYVFTLVSIIGAIVLIVRLLNNCSGFTKFSFVNFVDVPALFMSKFKPWSPVTLEIWGNKLSKLATSAASVD